MTATFFAQRGFGFATTAQGFGGKAAQPPQLAEHGKHKDDDQKKGDNFYHRYSP